MFLAQLHMKEVEVRSRVLHPLGLGKVFMTIWPEG
jgi:hypothetical protein